MQPRCKRGRVRCRLVPPLPTIDEDVQSNFDFVEKSANWERDVIDQDKHRRRLSSPGALAKARRDELRRQLKDMEQRARAAEQRARAAEQSARRAEKLEDPSWGLTMGLLGVSSIVGLACSWALSRRSQNL